MAHSHRRVRNNLRNQFTSLQSGRATLYPSFPFSLLPLNLLYLTPSNYQLRPLSPPLSLPPTVRSDFPLPFLKSTQVHPVKMAAEGMLHRSFATNHRADAESSSYTTLCAFFSLHSPYSNLNRTRLSQDYPGCAPRSSSHHQQQRGTPPHSPSSRLYQGSRYHHR